MVVNTIDAQTLQKMFLAGAANLESKKEWINDLNVFPVPDGDTGTNMTLTIMSAASEVSNITEPTFANLAKAISSGSLRGARGNSGVILSQLFRGFTKEIKEVNEINSEIIAKSFERAVETAYKAVMKPKEGTILTVAKGVAEKVNELAQTTEDLNAIFEGAIEYGDYVLSKTPDMLPVLKQAGVVDSGGQGLMTVLKGCYDAFLGKEIKFESAKNEDKDTKKLANAQQALENVDIKFGYCTEFIINLEKKFDKNEELQLKAFLESIGDSIVVVADDEVVKVHVHTNEPGVAITKALTYGSLSKIKIDNMREEHEERLMAESTDTTENTSVKEESANEERKEFGFIAVSAGEGLSEIFKGLGVDYLIEGGQTMNPSTEDMLNAIDKVNADTIFIFPNNSNIILAANQAASICENKEIIVIPSKTIPQGITAIINFVYDKSAKENEEHMIEEMQRVKTGQITYAVRDTNIDDKEIHQGDIMGIGDKAILTVGHNVKDTTIALINEIVDDETELISLYYGQEITEEQANEVASVIEEKYPSCDIEVQFGGQPIYYYVVSAE